MLEFVKELLQQYEKEIQQPGNRLELEASPLRQRSYTSKHKKIYQETEGHCILAYVCFKMF